ncbi:MAG: DUF983 domain-containing protein, partial [Pseudomonadota bacterium]
MTDQVEPMPGSQPAPPAMRGATLDDEAARPLQPALLRGWRGACPRCGQKTLFSGYLEIAHECSNCGEALHHHRADDLPAWITMILVGHALVPLLLGLENAFEPALWVHVAILAPFVIGASLWLLPRVKGAVVGMQWAWR